LGERLALGYQFHIASSCEQAMREAAPHHISGRNADPRART
jgi:hypothetical protein